MSQDYEQQAEDLDRFLAAHSLGGQANGAFAAQTEETRLAAELLDLAATLEPGAAFAAQLEERLLAELAARAGSAPPAGPTGSGAGSHNVRTTRITRTTPPRAGNGRHRRRSRRDWTPWGAMAAVFVCALLLLVPSVQASLRAFLQVGTVRIGEVPPTRPPGAGPTPTALPSPLDLAGQTTLAQARQQAGFAISLPTYPPDLGPPDDVFLQDSPFGLGNSMVVLAWLDRARPGQVRLALFELGSNIYFYKSAPQDVQQTSVNGKPALWTEGPYFVQVRQGNQTFTAQRLLVNGHVLIWTDGTLTYRLETTLSLSEAVRIAQSLH